MKLYHVHIIFKDLGHIVRAEVDQTIEAESSMEALKTLVLFENYPVINVSIKKVERACVNCV